MGATWTDLGFSVLNTAAGKVRKHAVSVGRARLSLPRGGRWFKGVW